MNIQYKRVSPMSGSCVEHSISVLGQTILVTPPTAVFGCFVFAAWVLAPLIEPQAEAMLEKSAWTLGRAWDSGVALTHLFEQPVGHARIVADDTADAAAPPTRAPIIIVPQPDIRAPPLQPRRGGEPPDAKPKRKNRHALHQPDTSEPPPGRLPDTLLPAPLPHRNPDGAP